MSSICFAQEHRNKDNIQICYSIGSSGIGGQDHCITIWFEDSLIFAQRICYNSIFNRGRYIGADTDISRYYEIRKQAILRHYQESNDYLVLDERVEISKPQFDELIKIINEIKVFVSEVDTNSDEIIISTKGSNHYVITDKDGTVIIVDWLGHYDRSRDLENAFGLKSYLRCPCVEKGLKQMNNSRKKR
ncbi:hypothetical protein FACS189434_11500 [Bacteroidia bacterium]|nr:hypothetical protein FACS189434_11500 [Bacteroidia bacterium]